MESSERTVTLAAETFQQEPGLAAEAKVSPRVSELESTARRVTIGNRQLFVVEGDLLYDEDELALYALQQEARDRVEATGAHPALGLDPSAALVGVASGGRIVRWRPGTVLRYCVLRASFPTADAYERAVEGMRQATQAWQDTCGVEFAHAAQHDVHDDVAASPDSIAPDLLFTVRFIDAGGEFIAAAFFPTYPPARRRVLIDPSYYADNLTFDPVGVLRHELGHVLGFRHEHIRSGAPALCPDEAAEAGTIIDLTAYDPKSVMHYFCGGVGSRELAITELDRAGAQRVYGPPFSDMLLVT